MSSKKHYFVDLFAGCGGLSLGLEQAGFAPIFVNELNQDAMETYLRNREHHFPLLRSKYNINDIKQMAPEEGFLDDLVSGFKIDYGINADCGDIDLVVGGPPCQGYSGIGHRRSYSVDKKQIPSNHLYQNMAYVINRLKPKIYLFENVRGLLHSRWTKDGYKGEIWEDIQNTFRSINGYTVRSELVYAKDYGVPQNRPRILLVGIRNDLHIRPEAGKVADGFLPEPVRGFSDLSDLLGDLIDPEYMAKLKTTRYPSRAKTEIQQLLRLDPKTNKVRPKGSEVSDHEYSKHSRKIVEKFKYMLENSGQIPDHMKTKKFAQRVIPAQWGPSGPSITATSLPDDYVHFCQPRSLSVREWARLQIFPDWYQFIGKRTTGGLRRAGNPLNGVHEREAPKYTQIGNAVPVKLAKEVGQHFMGLIK